MQAKLTTHQLQNKQFLLEQLSETAPDGNVFLKEGYKVVLAIDQLLIYSAGQRGFRIDLSLRWESVQ